MKKTQALLPLFKTFIRESQTGKRRKKNGEKITQGTINNYTYVYRNLTRYAHEKNLELRICDATRLTHREYISEKNYWKKFYIGFTKYLYSNGCHDNYVGNNIKIIRSLFNFLKREKNINTGSFHTSFYVRKESIAILVLSPEQLKYMIHDTQFHERLTRGEKKIKDMFLFGCTTGLRFSDLMLLTSKNFEKIESDWYLKIRSKKTKSFSSMKLPSYATSIFLDFKKNHAGTSIFPKISLFNFNKTLKRIGEKAGFVNPVDANREILGKLNKQASNKKQPRFCDKMSSHMMRRTAITTMLILGMPEHLVRVVSGHSMGSNSFQRYVHYARAYTNTELDKVYEQLNEYVAA